MNMEATWTFETLIPCHNTQELDLKLFNLLRRLGTQAVSPHHCRR